LPTGINKSSKYIKAFLKADAIHQKAMRETHNKVTNSNWRYDDIGTPKPSKNAK
jgi:hypothetical protein